jgi:hypothetical protein
VTDPSPFEEFERWRRAYAESLTREVRTAAELLSQSLVVSATQNFAQIFDEQHTAIDRLAEQVRAAVREPFHVAEQVRDAWEQSAKAMRELWEHAMPSNLSSLDIDVASDALEISAASGPCMVWAPRAKMVEELVSAGSFADRGAILVEQRTEVLLDLQATLDAATATVAEAQVNLHGFATDAVGAARDGHDAAAQSLAASAVSYFVHEILGHMRWLELAGPATLDLEAPDIHTQLKA